MIKNIKRIILVTVLAFTASSISSLAANTDFEQQLSQFESAAGSQRVAKANALMALLNDMEFTDAPHVFAAGTPADSLNLQIYYWASEYFYDRQDYDRAINYGEKAVPLSRKSSIEADCLSLLSLAYFRTNDYQRAAHYAKQCYELDAKTGDPDIMSSSLNTLAGIYLGAYQLDMARDYINRAISVARKADNPQRLAVLHATASEIYHAGADDAKALTHINRACDIERKLGNTPRLNLRLVQKASVLNGLKRYDEAEQVLLQVIPALKEMGDEHSLATAYNKLGMALRSQQREREAINYFRQAAEIFSRQGDLEGEMHAHRGLYESLWTINPDSAKIELDRFDFLKDSLYTHISAQSLARYRAEFDNDELHTQNLKQSRLTRYIAASLTILAILIATLVWWIMKRRMRMREEALQAIIDALSQDKSNKGACDTSNQAANEPVKQNDNQLLQQVVAVVKEIIANQEHIDVETVAAKLFMSRGNLNRRMKTLTGVTTQQYINRVRLEYARQLLDTDAVSTISEIGYKCGFDDASSFTRSFKNIFGMTPSAYRNRQLTD